MLRIDQMKRFIRIQMIADGAIYRTPRSLIQSTVHDDPEQSDDYINWQVHRPIPATTAIQSTTRCLYIKDLASLKAGAHRSHQPPP